MSRFLLAIRVQLDFSEIARFPLVNRLSFEMKKRCFEIADFGFLSLARLPISPPWLGNFRL